MLMRCTPSVASWLTVVKSLPTTTLTGFGATALTTASIRLASRMPGANRQSAPASAYAGQPTKRLGEIRPAGNEAFGSSGEDDGRARLVDGVSRRANPIDGEIEIEEWMRLVVCRVLNR